MSAPPKKFEKYKKIRLLNKGSYGKAYLVEAESDQSHAVIKQIEYDDSEKTVQEALLLKNMDHPNIIQFRDVYLTKSKKLCIVMEYADDGDLSTKIKRAKEADQPLNEAEIIDIFRQICKGMEYCHSK